MTNPEDFAQTSEWIELASILSDCCDVEANVIVYGKINRFRGIIDCVNADCTKIKIRYDATESGYPESHVIETCDIDEVRCQLCCDINWYQVDDCASPDLTGLPDYPPDGQAYLYVGDFNDPDCLFIYQGFGNWKDITNYTKVANNNIVDFDFDTETYVLTITMRDGSTHSVTLVRNSLASICFDNIPLDCSLLSEYP